MREFESGATEQNLPGIESGGSMRVFDTGAIRDDDTDKFDYDGFLSPLVLHRYAQYLHRHRHLADGSVRSSDNWQNGIPPAQYLKSKWRHFFDVWAIFRGWPSCVGQSEKPAVTDLEESLCGDLFNTMGMLHEVIKARLEQPIVVPAEAKTCGGCRFFTKSCNWNCLTDSARKPSDLADSSCFEPKKNA